MKKVLFIVPHEDDEVFVGGPMIMNLTKDFNYEVFVFIATNGDYYPFENGIRIKESLNALDMMGVKGDHIIFGGYGDCWRGTHIYNSPDDEAKTSQGGFEKTYVENPRYMNWHYQKFGDHATYTRRHYLQDVQSLVEDIKPDVILAVDMDTHRDHRCLSLLLDEALCNILRKKTGYCPILLKKYAYQGVLGGKGDFFHYPNRPTVGADEVPSNPFFPWGDRICYVVPDSCNTFFIRSSKLYKVIREYKSQDMWLSAAGFINTDIIYWQRHTNNLAITANITATSGNTSYLNDFKLIDTEDVVPTKCNHKLKSWRPDAADSDKNIRINFGEQVKTGTIIIYFNNLHPGIHGKARIEVMSSEGTKVFEKEVSVPDDEFSIVTIDTGDTAGEEIRIDLSGCSDDIGIGEIEVIPVKQEIPFRELLLNEQSERKGNIILEALKILDHVTFKIQTKCYWKFPDSYRKRRLEFDKENSIQ